MYRLTDDIARRRIMYSPPVVTVASVMVIDLPPARRGPGLSLGRYYAVLLECDEEIAEMERFLGASRSAPVLPDLFDRRPSRLRTDHVVLTRYEPPVAGWPWLSICRWPAPTDGSDRLPRAEMARGCYTMEMFDTPSALERHQADLLASLSRERSMRLRFVAGDRLPARGSC